MLSHWSHSSAGLELRLLCLTFLAVQYFGTTSSSLETQLEFHDVRQGEFARSLRSYQLSIPTKVNANGDHLSHSVSHFLPASTESRQRRRRDASSSSSSSNDDQASSVHYKVNIEGQDVHLQLTPNDGLLSPGLVVEHRTSGSGKLDGIRGRRISDNRCHFTGQVKGHPQSAVAIATCEGLHGYIRLGEKDYFIEPVKGHEPSEVEGHPHLVYRRSALPPELHIHPDDHKRHHEDDEREHGTCGVKEDVDERGERSMSGEERKRHRSRQKRSVSVERNVETLVVVDRAMVEYYKNDNIENYVLTIMNMVSTMFHDSSIGNAVNIVLAKIMYLENDEEDLKITHHADHTLSSFCRWQMGINPRDETNPNHHDVAILLTRVNICSRSNEPCNTLGLSQVSGLCQAHRSCNINEDTGLALAFTVTHELGHNFGMKHDTPENGCEASSEEMQFVMSPQLTAEASPLMWSNCSRNAITNFLDRDWGHCLDDIPTDHEFNIPNLPPGVMYDIDHQCRLQYGPEAEYCDGIDNLCVTVWCRVDTKCMTKLEAAAEGTICGDNEWCFGGRCVAIGDKPLAIDSHWGEWSAWSECTRTCGAGVSYSERLCNNPPPSHGGRYCLGERRRYRTCNTEECPSGTPNFREHQCAQFNHISYKGRNYEWEPVATQATPCQLHCKPKNRQFSVMMKDMVTDGTPCRIGRKDMCISGRCRMVGCDWVIESDALEDSCGVCHGDGTACKRIEQDFLDEAGMGYVEAAIIPEGARNIRVEEVAEANNYLAIRNEKGHYYLNGHWYIQWSGNYDAAGTVVQYTRDGNKEKLVAPGPISEPLHVMLLFQSQNPGVKLEYTVPVENATERRRPEFHWRFSDWTHCTHSCGRGNQISQVVCVEKEAGIVEDSNCESSTRPDDMYKPCNEHLCPAKWWAGPWQHCSVSCGGGGIQKRTVLCVRQRGPDEQIALEDWECEGLEKPSAAQPCKHKDPCPVEDSMWQTGPWIGKCETDDPCAAKQKRLITCLEPSGLCDLTTKPEAERRCPNTACGKWIVSDWSKCTQSCDGGKQFRKVTCVGGDACNKADKPEGNQPCNMHECPRSPADREKYHSNNALQDQVDPPPTKDPDFQVLVPFNDDVTEDVEYGTNESSTVEMVADGVTFVVEREEENVTASSTVMQMANSTASEFRWMSQYWTECSRLCGEGYRTRRVLCIHLSSKQTVPDDFCSQFRQPISRETCQLAPCNTWSTTPWQSCSMTCGEGVQQRNVSCPVGTLCDPTKRPEDKKICDAGPCAEWVTDPWEECSKSCGGGRQQRNVRCVNLVNHEGVALCNTDAQPPAQQECNTQDCPKDSEALEGRESVDCSSDKMAHAMCQSLRRMGKCSQAYIQRRCCQSCRDWRQSTDGASTT